MKTTNRRTSIVLTPEQDAAMKTLGRGLAEIVRNGLARELNEYNTGDVWVGSGIWRRWRLTTAHPASNHGQPVLVDPEGVGRGPGDIE